MYLLGYLVIEICLVGNAKNAGKDGHCVVRTIPGIDGLHY